MYGMPKDSLFGETSRTVKERLKENDADVRHGRNKPVADHFGSSGHTAEKSGGDCSRGDQGQFKILSAGARAGIN